MYCTDYENTLSPDDKLCSACEKDSITEINDLTESSPRSEESVVIPPMLDLFTEPTDTTTKALASKETSNNIYALDINYKHYYRSATIKGIISAIIILTIAVVGFYLIVTQTSAVKYVKSIFTQDTEAHIQRYDTLPIKRITSEETKKPDGKYSYEPINLFQDTYGKDESGTCWAYNYHDHPSGATLTVELAHREMIHGIRFQNGYTKNEDKYNKNRKIKEIKIEYGDGLSELFTIDVSKTYQDAWKFEIIELSNPAETETLKIHITKATEQKDKIEESQDDVCISFLSIF